MNGKAFKLGVFAKPDGKVFAFIVIDDDAIEIASVRAGTSGVAGSIDPLLDDWDANFAKLQEAVAWMEKEGRPGAVKLSTLRPLPPVRRPGKMLYAAQNFQEHVDEMLRAGMTPAGGPKFTGESPPRIPTCSSKRRALWPAPMTTSPSRAA